MRRVLTTLMILLVVVVAGLTALVLLVNPNDFRAYMVRQVETRSGYQLNLDGPLRWHVWPQLSILSGRMSLTAPGASQPLVRAENMRLDVALMPLLSHQLQVKQVMLKGAVVQLTPATEAVRGQDAPVGPKDNSLPDVAEDRGWSFDIASLQVADSLLVFQRANDELITVRDIRLEMDQDRQHKGTLDFSGRITRDQQDTSLSFSADIDGSDYPHSLTANLTKLNWQMQGADLPTQGISGQGSMQAQWLEDEKKLSFSNLKLTANDSAVAGDASVVLADKPEWLFNLQFDKLDLDNLLSQGAPENNNGTSQQAQSQSTQPRPVIADSNQQSPYSALKGYQAMLNLKANQVLWRGMNFTNVTGNLSNQAGLLTVSALQGELGGGKMSLPGTLDARKDTPQADFQPKIDNIEIGTILKAFDYPIQLSGKLSLAGDFSGSKIDADDFRRHWQGNAHIELLNSRAEGLNFQQLVQQAVERSTNVQAMENLDTATTLDKTSVDLELDNGQLTMSNMDGQSSLLAVTGGGTLDLVKEQGDMQFNVRVTDGWKGDSKLVETLKKTAVPLRVYGPWQQLSYSLQVDQVLRKQLQDEMKRRLNDWAERNQESQGGKDVKKLLDKL
ncbi:AsmA protein [Yokenella regensburgei]|uniref:AsmA protein n=1 Tax=Yokenella regensburgei TaxID=158877 RepID=A0ABX9RZ84_9ENTR|nr:outer membrane assembly protein AsmA [Yokenella regensburgei]QIU89605.1 outer membrane assembly protein AsmA [Yokenella regensburgei]RKR63799.1 AsmA protein [Yokenella regensburgei]VFS26218.1 putative assembly protein [Yokenella regensburgei]